MRNILKLAQLKDAIDYFPFFTTIPFKNIEVLCMLYVWQKKLTSSVAV